MPANVPSDRPVDGELGGSSCVWCQDGDYDSDTWETGCGHCFTINDGTPKDNDMKFCCFCGGKLDQRLQDMPEDEDTPDK